MSKPLGPNDSQFILNVRVDKKFQHRIAAAQHFAGLTRTDIIETALDMLLDDADMDTISLASDTAWEYVQRCARANVKVTTNDAAA
ncbi:hypothetical protein [Corynebacterium terpenotabidum]|uniref:Uncharacterized protein n=1 Tax=Corynebacterium terpenotabidum Y-11 TaxID=1200352 RepID=S4XES3_9CORY|nr:hypothetical protein [Corynebacterium terpenotabidum]AGP30110.1 hypothetical protein A606_02285 [Corynebacterium terpenotabidum Y-11]